MGRTSRTARIAAAAWLALGAVACNSTDTGSGDDVDQTAGETTSTAAAGLDERVQALAARAGYAVYDIADETCRPLHGVGLERPVPVASVFKLWVLDTLARRIDAGNAHWDDTVTVRDDLRSDPSGEIYHVPAGTNVTLRHVAERMISISDNTATDLLIHHLGRDDIEATIRELAPDGAALTVPLLSTADMARLKYVSPDLGAEYLALAGDLRAGFLSNLAERVPFPWRADATAVSSIDLTTPRSIDQLEWFASGADPCRTTADLARLAGSARGGPLGEILSTGSALPPGSSHTWDDVWFKGGSEPGVLALAYRLVDAQRDRVVVVALSDPDAALTPTPDGEAVIREILDLAAAI